MIQNSKHIRLKQTTGQSTRDGMSQKAITEGISAVSGAINKYEVDTVAKVGTTALALQFARMANISNTLVSTDILTLSLTATAETKTGEYLLTFVTGATPPTITWPVECKEAIVISANRKYIISFVRISDTRIFTFYDEEMI